MKMQEGSLWGGAIAANQCEGAYDVDGIPLLGYTCWGPIDIVSASTGEDLD